MAEERGDDRHHHRAGSGDGESDGRGGDGREVRRRVLCCRELQLLEFPDKYVIQSVDPDAPGHAFSIGRSDGLIDPFCGDLSSLTPSKVSTIYGVVGVIGLLSGTYMLLITSREEVGSHIGSSVYLVKSMRFLSCNEASRQSSSQEKKDEAYFMSLLRTIESTPGLYYSYERDLTLNLQSTYKITKERMHKPLWKQADPRFVWNHNLLEDLIENKLDAFIVPVIQGNILKFVIIFKRKGFQSMQLSLKDSPATVTIISRRCNRRLGTRMWRRGANLEGSTANFIETEQLVEYKNYRSSFLQIRGSIPLLWEQIVDLSYKPRLNIINHDEMSKVVERHFHDLEQRYGEILVVDLTNQHGDEGRLSKAFADEMEKLPHVRYVSFDFHHNCAKGNLDNLQILYDQIKADVEKQGYFLINPEGDILLEQNGIVRDNCIDCLDRTNVTQSYMARKSLNSQLLHMGAFSSNESLSTYNGIYERFNIMWAEHGDQISLEYAGTLAMKGDLVRYGRQTVVGMIKDGMSALSRYYLNNFQDGVRQDALDLISGRYNVSRNLPSPFQLNGFESFAYLPMASAFIVGGITFTTFTLNQAGRNTQHFVSSVLWAGLAAGVVALVKANGQQMCSRPRLCGLL